MKTVSVVTPSRLHFALIDLNGDRGRIDGSVGLSISQPQVRVYAQRASGLKIVGDVSDVLIRRAYRVFDKLQQMHDLPGAHIRIESVIPLHIGLGAGTQLTLGIARAVYALYDLDWDTRSVAHLIGRGGTSGIGVVAFDSGGFILDGGHAFPQQKVSFLPSSASEGTPLPPVLLRHDFPDWPILLVTPRCHRISGKDEIHRFRTLCPIPRSTAEHNCHIILMQLLPAMMECDLDAFGDALNRLQEIGWKRVEYEAQGPVVQKVREFLMAHGATGVALSSWGPTMAVFGEDVEELATITKQFLAGLPEGGTCMLTRANNQGARVQ